MRNCSCKLPMNCASPPLGAQGEYNSHGYDVEGFNKDGFDKYGELQASRIVRGPQQHTQQLPAKPAEAFLSDKAPT